MAQSEKHTGDLTLYAPNRLALICDFDQTLASKTFDGYLEFLGLDTEAFTQERVEPLKQEGWDTIPARAYALAQAAREGMDVSRKSLET